MAKTGADFSKLLQESRQLNARIRAGGHDAGAFMPQLQRGLEQIEELSSQLAAKVAAANGERTAQGKAALFLAAKGFDLTGLEGDLKKLATIVPGPAAHTTMVTPFESDLDTFLGCELDGIVVNTLSAMGSLSLTKANELLNAERTKRWELTKTHLSALYPSIITDGSSKARFNFPKESPKIAAYAKVVRAFNEARLKNASFTSVFDLPRAFERELRSCEDSDSKTEMLLDCWRVFKFILNDQTNKVDIDNVFEEPSSKLVKELSASYLANLDTSASLPWKKRLVMGGRQFLEDLYIRFVDRTIAQYPRDAMLGGRPSRVERIRAFCDIKIKRMSPAELANVELMSNNNAIWMLIYLLVRCGYLEEALTVVQSNEIYIQRTEPHQFLTFFKSFVSGQIPSSMMGQIRLEYNKLLSVKTDPYKMALLKLMGRCDLARKSISEVVQTSEDYIWLQYWLLEDVSEKGESGSAYTLLDLQQLVLDYGPRHFDPKNSNPWHYFEILSLVGLFEKGIEYLHQTGQIADAVHFATAMIASGTFRIAENTNDPLFLKANAADSTRIRINYATLVLPYIRIHEDIVDSINTVFLLTLLSNIAPQNNKIVLDVIRDIVLSSGDFSTLLGDVRSDGSSRPGLLSQYSSLLNLPNNSASNFIQTVTSAAAERCDLEGRFREALQLYNLAGRYDNVLKILCHRLSRAFVTIWSPLEADELCLTAGSIINYYSSQTHINSTISPAVRSTCSTLITLLQFRRLYEESQWPLALETLSSLTSLIPLDGDVATIAATAERIRDLPDVLTLILPELLVMTMTVIVKRSEELSSFIGIDVGRAQQSEILKKMGRTLMTFVGMFRLRIPQETCAQLARMQQSIF